MIDQLNQISQSWWDWMAPMFWQVSLLVIIISGIDALIRKWAWPQVRYALWALVLLKLVIPPTWSFSGSVIPNIRLIIQDQAIVEFYNKKIVQPPAQISESLKKSKLPEEKRLNKKPSEFNDPNKISSFSQSSNFTWKFYLMSIWILGIILFSGLLFIRISKLRRWHKEQEKKKNIPVWFHELLVKIAKRLSIERLPAIVFSNEAVTPAVYGVFRPVFLLPEKYIESLSKEEAEHVLLHELAHVKRGDLIVHGICLFLQIIYWFNPFLIWVRKQMKHVREICCDMTIANILREKTKMYRQTLVNTARELLTESLEPGMGLLGLFEEPFRLISRLKWLEKNSWEKRHFAFGNAIIISLLFTAFVLPMGEIDIQNSPLPDKQIEKKNEIKNLREQIQLLNAQLNTAFIKWDFGTIEKYYTEDIIFDQEGRPTVSGKEAVINEFKQAKFSGLKFYTLENFIIDLWKDGDNIYVVESYLYSLSLQNINLKLSGTGKSFTIWQVQKDGSFKIKYSILNVDSIIPNTTNN